MSEKKLALEYPILGSSEDVSQIALSVKGVAILLVPVIISFAKLSGWDLMESDLVNLIETLFGIVGSVVLAYGLVRKLINKAKSV